MTDTELFDALNELRDTMIAVATGRSRIQDVNEAFRRKYADVASALARRGIKNRLPYSDLWEWYERWKSGDMPSYQSRRVYVAEIFTPLTAQLQAGRAEEVLPTGWTRVDRTVTELRDRLGAAENAEQFQAVGLLCREALISLAQAVYDPLKHPTLDGKAASETDAGRMLEGYIAVELGGGANEEVRRHAKSALALALALQHKRTASFREAAISSEATTTVINLIAIVSGRRDPQQ